MKTLHGFPVTVSDAIPEGAIGVIERASRDRNPKAHYFDGLNWHTFEVIPPAMLPIDRPATIKVDLHTKQVIIT